MLFWWYQTAGPSMCLAWARGTEAPVMFWWKIYTMALSLSAPQGISWRVLEFSGCQPWRPWRLAAQVQTHRKKKKYRFFLNIKAYFFSPEVWGVYLSSPKWNYFNPCFQLAIEFDVHSRYSTSLISSFTKMQIFTPSKAMMFSHHWPSPYN